MELLEIQAASQRGRHFALPAALRRAVSFPVLLATLLVGLVIVVVAERLHNPSPPSHNYAEPVINIFEGDTWFHILVGEDILRTHTFPTTDSYTFTINGNQSLALEWLGEILMAGADHLGGLRALTLMFFVLSSTLVLLLYYYSSLRCGNSKAAFVACLPIFFLISVFFTLRPQLFGYIFFFTAMILVEHFRRGRTWALWLLPPIFVLWVNMHGSFVLGFLLLGFYWAAGLVRFSAGGLEAQPWTRRQRLHLELVMLFCALALAVTPYGTRLAGDFLHEILNARLGMVRITEYQPLGDGQLKIFLLLLFTFLAAQVILRYKCRLDDLGLLLFAAYGTFVHERLLIFCIPVLTALLAMPLARWVPKYEPAKDKFVLNAALLALAIFVAFPKFFPSKPDLEKAIATAFPSGAVDYLQKHPVRGRMLNPDFWGAYLVRTLGRGHKIFIDGYSQPFEDAGVYEDNLHIIDLGRDTPLLLRKYRLDACLTYRWSPLAAYLSAAPDWQQAYQDNLAVIFVRREPPTGGK